MVRHLSEGLRRRVVDEPAALSDTERGHLAACSTCGAAVEAARTDRDAVAAVLTPGPAGAPDADPAWQRLVAGLEPGRERDRPAVAVAPRRRSGLRRPVVGAAVAAALAVGGTAAAAAADWLPVFRPATVAPVTVTAGDLAGLPVRDLTGMPDLSAYGRLSVPREWRPQPVADAATAAARSGTPVPAPAALPTGVSGRPAYAVLPRATARFTFSAAKARAAAAQRGAQLPAMPAGMDGAVLQLRLGPGVVTSWTQGGGVPTLALVRMAVPTASTSGIRLTTLQSYLLAQPGIPAGLAAQLRALPVDGSVLPVPVPADVATSERTDVGGRPATLVRMRDQSGGAVIWIDRGRLQIVAGLLSGDELLDVARGLR